MNYWSRRPLAIDYYFVKIMIVSHQHKYIFFAVPKTATHAIREALRPYNGPDDWEQQQLFEVQASPIAEIASIGHGHITANEIQVIFDQDEWQRYFKFAFVRNPFERFVSACAFLNRNNSEFKQQPTEWMKVAMTRERFRQRVLIRPQSEQLLNINSELSMDYVGRFENIQASLDQILDHLLLPRIGLSLRNSSDHSQYHTYYDSALKQQVSAFYQQDLDMFGYGF